MAIKIRCQKVIFYSRANISWFTGTYYNKWTNVCQINLKSPTTSEHVCTVHVHVNRLPPKCWTHCALSITLLINNISSIYTLQSFGSRTPLSDCPTSTEFSQGNFRGFLQENFLNFLKYLTIPFNYSNRSCNMEIDTCGQSLIKKSYSIKQSVANYCC